MKRNYLIVALVLVIFFVISFLTNIPGAIIPDIINSFHLSLGLAGFLPFAFFLAYGPMSIPAGTLVERYKEKTVLVVAFILATVGALLFALFPVFRVALPSLFTIGLGMAMLQVAINPLLRTAGGEEHFAFNSVLAQLIFGLASFISPRIYSYLVLNLNHPPSNPNILVKTLGSIVPDSMTWISVYWVFAAVALLMVLLLLFVRLPKVKLKEDEKAGAFQTHIELLKNKYVILFFIGIMAYVGTEQGVSNWISKFLAVYHGYNPQTDGARAVSNFWGLMTVGCLLGLVLLKIFDSRKILIAFASAAIVCLLAALCGGAKVSLVAFQWMGFFASVMWSIVFSLALNSVSKHHGSFSGILCTGIIGGALGPLIVGAIGDVFGLRVGLMFLFLTLGYILSIGFWAKPIITNKTVTLRKKK